MYGDDFGWFNRTRPPHCNRPYTIGPRTLGKYGTQVTCIDWKM